MATVKIRIAICVDDSGNWNACGYSNDDPQEQEPNMLVMASEGCAEAVITKHYWIEAVVMVPEPETVQGKAMEVQS